MGATSATDDGDDGEDDRGNDHNNGNHGALVTGSIRFGEGSMGACHHDSHGHVQKHQAYMTLVAQDILGVCNLLARLVHRNDRCGNLVPASEQPVASHYGSEGRSVGAVLAV